MTRTKVVTVGPANSDICGTDNVALQKAVDRVAAAGGGVVEIRPGVYTMNDSLHLRSGVRVRGAGADTVLRKAPMVKSALSADLGYGHYDVSLAEPDKFRVGMGVHIKDNGSGGFYGTVATLTWRDGDRFGTSRWMNHDYARARDAIVRSVFPVVSGYYLEDASVENLTIDGDRAENEYLNGCRGGGVFLLQARNVAMRKLTVHDYNGDAISFQQTVDVVVEDCVCENNSGHGLHPGSGSVRPIMRRVRCIGNAHDGIFYCLRVSYSLTEDCVIERNGHNGISIGGRDTDQLIRNNIIRGNAQHGLFFRNADKAMAGSRCRFEGNTLADNCQSKGRGEIFIGGETGDVHVLGNHITVGKAAVAVVVGPKAGPVVVYGNTVTPADAKEVECQGPASAVSTGPPARPLAVGPAAAPADAARHLSAWPASGGPTADAVR